MFARPSPLPLIVVSVDEPEIRFSITDDNIEYGHIHGDIERLRKRNKSPIYHISLQHEPHWNKRIRTQPTTSIIQELMEIGRQDGRACIEQIQRDFGRHNVAEIAHDRVAALA